MGNGNILKAITDAEYRTKLYVLYEWNKEVLEFPSILCASRFFSLNKVNNI